MKQLLINVFMNRTPDWLFVPLYNMILSRYSRVKIKRDRKGWLIYGEDTGDLKLLSPTPRFFSVKFQDMENKFASCKMTDKKEMKKFTRSAGKFINNVRIKI